MGASVGCKITRLPQFHTLCMDLHVGGGQCCADHRIPVLQLLKRNDETNHLHRCTHTGKWLRDTRCHIRVELQWQWIFSYTHETLQYVTIIYTPIQSYSDASALASSGVSSRRDCRSSKAKVSRCSLDTATIGNSKPPRWELRAGKARGRRGKTWMHFVAQNMYSYVYMRMLLLL